MSVKTKPYITKKMYDDLDEDKQQYFRIAPDSEAFMEGGENTLLMVPTFNRKQRRTLLRAMRQAPGKIKVRTIKEANNKKRRK